MAYKEKKRGRRKYKNWNISRTKRAFPCRNRKEQVASGFKTLPYRSFNHSSFKSIIPYPIAKSSLVSGFKMPLCTYALWETKMLKNQIWIGVCGCGSYCLEHTFDWVSAVGFFFARKTTFYLWIFDIINDTTKDKILLFPVCETQF